MKKKTPGKSLHECFRCFTELNISTKFHFPLESHVQQEIISNMTVVIELYSSLLCVHILMILTFWDSSTEYKNQRNIYFISLSLLLLLQLPGINAVDTLNVFRNGKCFTTWLAFPHFLLSCRTYSVFGRSEKGKFEEKKKKETAPLYRKSRTRERSEHENVSLWTELREWNFS